MAAPEGVVSVVASFLDCAGSSPSQSPNGSRPPRGRGRRSRAGTRPAGRGGELGGLGDGGEPPGTAARWSAVLSGLAARNRRRRG
eukprot:12235795-Alexandrium_andersonii.AAC.1